MSDTDKELARSVIIAAIAAAGPKGTNEAAWKAKINEAIPHVVSMLNESSRQHHIAEEVLGAQVFTAIYRGYELEETSKRCVVTIETQVSKRYPDGLEPIRSHRTDNAQGKTMQARLDRLEDGDTILVWKSMESIDEDTKVRVLVHFEKLPYRKDADSARTQRNTASPNEARDHEGSPAESAPHYTDEIDSERIVGWRHATLQRLTDEQFEILKARLGKLGYDFYGVSEIEWVEIVRPEIHKMLNR